MESTCAGCNHAELPPLCLVTSWCAPCSCTLLSFLCLRGTNAPCPKSPCLEESANPDSSHLMGQKSHIYRSSACRTIQPCCRWLPWWVVYRQFIWVCRSCSHVQLPSEQSWSSCTCTNYSWHLLSLLIKEICCYLENIWSEQKQKGQRRMLNSFLCQDLGRKVCPAQT